MKIALSTQDSEFYNIFFRICKDAEHNIINAKVESVLFDIIENETADAFIIDCDNLYFKKAVDFIKKRSPYIPIIGILSSGNVPNIPADIYMDMSISYRIFSETVLHNISTYIKTFTTLKKLTTKMHEKIEFGNCVYDPTRMILYHKGVEIKKLSPKEGGILEILAINYGDVVKKNVILEKVWRKTDYFAGRSMDVYITYLRNTLRNNQIALKITNVSGIGLILESI